MSDPFDAMKNAMPIFSPTAEEVQNHQRMVDKQIEELFTASSSSMSSSATLSDIAQMMGVDDTKPQAQTFQDESGRGRIMIEGKTISFRDSEGELVFSIGETVKIGAKYEDHPLDTARQIFDAIKVFKALE